MTKRIVVLNTGPKDQENACDGLAGAGGEWKTIVAGSPEEAMTVILQASVEAIVIEHRKGDAAGARLFDWALEHFPEVARVLIAEQSEREDALRAVRVSHQFLPRPVTPEILKGTIQSSRLLEAAMPNEVLFALAERIKMFPPLPSLYLRVLNELGSPNYSSQTVAEIVSRDLAMTTRLLQVINSGFYGLPRRITDLTEAVNLLGQETVKTLVLGIQMFLDHEHIKPLYFSIHQLWQHSNSVAHSARLVAQMETGNKELADEAYTAGLLHDLGKLVLANNFEAQYNKVQQIARDTRRPFWEVETEEFGVSHAELGAFILGRWGMPAEFLEATAFHHRPGWRGGLEFSALTAVHVANAIEHELRTPQHGLVSSQIDLPYIDSLGLMKRVEAWKDCLREGKLPAQRKSSPSASRTSGPAPDPRARRAETGSRTKIACAVVGAVGLLAALGFTFWNRGGGEKPASVRAKSRPGVDATSRGGSNDTSRAGVPQEVDASKEVSPSDAPSRSAERE